MNRQRRARRSSEPVAKRVVVLFCCNAPGAFGLYGHTADGQTEQITNGMPMCVTTLLCVWVDGVEGEPLQWPHINFVGVFVCSFNAAAAACEILLCMQHISLQFVSRPWFARALTNHGFMCFQRSCSCVWWNDEGV